MSDLIHTFTDLPHCELMEIKLTDNQHKFLYEKELDGVKFKELVDKEFIETVKQYISALPQEALCLMGAWDVQLYRGTLRKWRAEHDTNQLLLEDIELKELDKLAEKVDFIALERVMATVPNEIKKLARNYRAARTKLAKAYSTLTGRELKQKAFANASSLHKLREEVVEYISSK